MFDYDALIMEYIELDINANGLTSNCVPEFLTTPIRLPVLI